MGARMKRRIKRAAKTPREPYRRVVNGETFDHPNAPVSMEEMERRRYERDHFFFDEYGRRK